MGTGYSDQTKVKKCLCSHISFLTLYPVCQSCQNQIDFPCLIMPIEIRTITIMEQKVGFINFYFTILPQASLIANPLCTTSRYKTELINY